VLNDEFGGWFSWLSISLSTEIMPIFSSVRAWFVCCCHTFGWLVQILNTDISQYNLNINILRVETRLRCGGIFKHHFIANLLPSVPANFISAK